MSPILGVSPSVIGGVVYNDVDMLEATHRALHKFIPRHEDEIEIEIGDPIYVQKEADDLWCEGRCHLLFHFIKIWSFYLLCFLIDLLYKLFHDCRVIILKKVI